MTDNMDATPSPVGDLVLQTVPMPKDTNAAGDIFGGWLLSQMDIAGAIAAGGVVKGRVVTVAIHEMSFLVPVEVGAVVSCYAEIKKIGKSSVHVNVEAWKLFKGGHQKVTDGVFIYVAVDKNRRTRVIAK